MGTVLRKQQNHLDQKRKSTKEYQTEAMATIAESLKAQREKMETIHNEVTNFIMANFPEARANPTVPVAQALVEEQQVLNRAFQLINAYGKEISVTTYSEVVKRLILSYETQVALRNTQRRVREYKSNEVRSRRRYHWQMTLAKTEAEKNRLRLERKRYIARRWYYNNQSRERAKSRRRNRSRREKGCCPFTMLGIKPTPKRSVKLWITQCKTCHRKEYGDIGCNEEGRVGTYFRGEWFDYIDPQTGTGTTFSGEVISLTRIY